MLPEISAESDEPVCASGGMGLMVHRSSVGAIVVGIALTGALSACTPGSVATQDPTRPVDSPSSSSSSAANTSVAPLPTPSVVPVAQGAVNSLIALYNILDTADRDPRSFSPSQIEPYAEPQALADFTQQYQLMAQNGLAYRGKSEDPRLTVLGVESATSILLQSCPLADPSDPEVQYTVATGQPVATNTGTSTSIHRKVIRMVLTAGTWKLDQLQTDPTVTCPA